MSSEKKYLVRNRGKVSGPYSFAHLKSLRAQGRLARFHEISEDGQTWAAASTLVEIFPAPTPPERRPGRSTDVAPDKAQVAEVTVAKSHWHYLDERGVQQGPIRQGELIALLENDSLPWTTLVWQAGMPDWASAASVTEFGAAQSMAATAPPTRSTLAVLSLILTLLWIGCLGSLAGIILGVLALREIDQSQGRIVGKGMAWTAIGLGIASVCMTPLVAFAIFIILHG